VHSLIAGDGAYLDILKIPRQFSPTLNQSDCFLTCTETEPSQVSRPHDDRDFSFGTYENTVFRLARRMRPMRMRVDIFDRLRLSFARDSTDLTFL